MAIDFPTALVFVFIILIIGFSIWVMAWYSIKKRQTEKGEHKNPDPIIRTLQISLVIILMLVVLLFLTGKEITKEWIFLFFVLIIVIYWVNYSYLKKMNPIPMQKLIQVGLDLIRDLLDTEIYVGETFSTNFKLWKVTENETGTLLDSIANVVVHTKDSGSVLLKLNVYTGYPVEFLPRVPQDLIERIYDERIGKQYDVERERLVQSVKVDKQSGDIKEDE